MARTFYDNLAINQDIELDLSMLEATGAITHDESKNHIIATLHNTPIWQALAAGRYGLRFHEANSEYLDAPVADTTALNFTSTDYSLAVWLSAGHYDDDDMIIMGRYSVDAAPAHIPGSGWELYYYDPNNTITLRHSHNSLAPNLTSSSFSRGWTYDGDMHLFGATRIGGAMQHYRDGYPIATTVEASGMLDPDTNVTYDLVIGCRFTKDTHYWHGRLHRPRAWSRGLSDDDHRFIWEMERDWFGV
ncbi:hypothetical protein ES703_39597 [subsurface metagenome]